MVKQNPATDPVSAAMSAIESALNLTDEDEAALVDSSAPTPQLIPARPTVATPVLKPTQLAGDSPALLRAATPPQSAPESDPKPAIPAATPANDDRENVGAILQAMNERPASRTPFLLALVASCLWAGVCGLYLYISVLPSASRRPLEMLMRPETPLFLLAALGPIIFMFAFAALSRRSSRPASDPKYRRLSAPIPTTSARSAS
jgi:hypothetical protein